MSTQETLITELMAFYGEGEKYPSIGQWRSFVETQHADKVVMVNLIKLVESAENPYETGTSLSGTELMMAYGAVSEPAVARVGGKSIFQGMIGQSVIGNGDWDVVALVEYPSAHAFIELFQDPEYRSAHKYRAAACADHSLLLSFPL